LSSSSIYSVPEEPTEVKEYAIYSDTKAIYSTIYLPKYTPEPSSKYPSPKKPAPSSDTEKKKYSDTKPDYADDTTAPSTKTYDDEDDYGEVPTYKP
jgi:hypothetical protein